MKRLKKMLKWTGIFLGGLLVADNAVSHAGEMAPFIALVKLVTGDLRIGLKEGLIEEAIARATSQPAEKVREANMLCGDLAAVTRAAREGRLHGRTLGGGVRGLRGIGNRDSRQGGAMFAVIDSDRRGCGGLDSAGQQRPGRGVLDIHGAGDVGFSQRFFAAAAVQRERGQTFFAV